MFKLKLKLLIILLLINYFATIVLAGDRKEIKIASGNILGEYYDISLRLCGYISDSNKNVSCTVVPTLGTIHNLDLLRSGAVDFAIVASNIALDAYHGSRYFTNHTPMSNMYQLLKLHDEIFTIIARDESHLLTFQDLEGKKISNGRPGSDTTFFYKALEAAYSFKVPLIDIELSPEDYAKALCDAKQVDAIMMMTSMTTGYPSKSLRFITNSCNTEFVSLDESVIDEFVKQNKSFKKRLLPAGLYPGVDHDQHTLSVDVILVGTDKIDPQIVRNLQKALDDNINPLKLSHPVLNDLDDEHFKSNFVLPRFNHSKIDSTKTKN